jgi:esterase/lipase superfamily enzyme
MRAGLHVILPCTLLLSACAANPVINANRLVPLISEPVAPRQCRTVAAGTRCAVEVVAVTTRARAPAEAEQSIFTGERGGELDFARVDVAIPANHMVGQIEKGDRQGGEPSNGFALVGVSYLRRADALHEVKGELELRAPADRDILLFVHGFNTNFGEAVTRTAQLTRDLPFAGVPVLFSWPSRAKLVDYIYDRDSATYSRPYLSATIELLARETGARRVHIVAHSMGNWALLEALRDLHARTGMALKGRLGNVILAAPDVDVDVFRQEAGAIRGLPESITLLASSEDRALKASARLAGNVPRAGEVIDGKPIQVPGIVAIDLSGVEAHSDPIAAHGAFANQPQVVTRIGALLRRDDPNDAAEGAAPLFANMFP